MTRGFVAITAWFALIPALPAQNASKLPPPAQIKIDYNQHVRPILAEKCFGCHGPTQQQSGLRLDRRQLALRGGDYGAVINPGKSESSKLIQRVSGPDAGLQMPPTGPLDPAEIGILRAWIDQGAEMPGNVTEVVQQKRATDPVVQSLINSIRNHDMPAVRKALAKDKALAKSADASGSTPLMYAAYAGTVEAMTALIDAGADVNARNERKATALHWAVHDAAKLKLLLTRGADVNAKTVDMRTPLHSAAGMPAGAPLVRVLLEGGADPNARLIPGQTPLFAAAAVSVESMQLLLDKGADPNAKAQTGGTPLMGAANNDVKAVALLLSKGADPKARNGRGTTALANAANRGDLPIVKLLLEKGADVNAVDYRGYNVLMHAAYNDGCSAELIRLLLAKGADIRATGEGETALSLAAKRGETEITRLLREAQNSNR
jgi:ankyrin repeat protein